MEIWDGYNRDATKAGIDLIRGIAIPDGIYHIVSEIMVRHDDGSYLVMQRDKNKNPFPGQYEASAGGSILKGETPYEGAVRELLEETGIKTEELTHFYTVPSDRNNTIYFGYLAVTDCDKNSVTLQEGETIAYRWLGRKEFLEFIKTPEFVFYKRERWEPFFDRI